MQLDQTATTPETRKMLAYLKAHVKVTHAELSDATDVSDYHRTNYVAKLRRLGLLQNCGTRDRKAVFTIHDLKSAAELAAKKRGRREGVMWSTMRILKNFTPQDVLTAIADARGDIDLKRVETYCRLLLKAGYLSALEKARPNGHPARYMLVNDTGPLPPIQRTLPVVVDGNTDRAAYIAGARQ